MDCNRYDFNAFFVRSGIGEEFFPEISAEEGLRHPLAKEGNKTRLPQVVNYEWVEV